MIRVYLKKPILIRGLFKYETLTEINMRLPKAGDLKGMDFSNPSKQTENMIKLVSKISGVKEKDLEEISLPDWNDVSEALNGLMRLRK